MRRTPLDFLREWEDLKQTKREGALAFLRELNEKRRTKEKTDRLLDILREPRIPAKRETLIMGIACNNGVVIASDRKILRGGEAQYSNKVFDLDLGGTVLFAAEGLTGIRDDFFLLLREEIARRKGVDTLYEVKVIVEDIIATLTERYSDRVRDQTPIAVLMGGLERLSTGDARLYLIHSPGYGELVPFICSGHGGDYAYSIAKFLCDPSLLAGLALEDAARRAAFVVAWVSEDIDSTVGGEPQVCILKNGDPKVKPLTSDEVKGQMQAAIEARGKLPTLFGFEIISRATITAVTPS